MKKSFLKPILLAALAFFTFSSCSDDNDTVPQTEPTYDMTGFAKGAFDSNGKPTAVLNAFGSNEKK